MPNYTNNLQLEKPLQSENYNIDIFNSNADKIDTAIQEVKGKVDGLELKAEKVTIADSGNYFTSTSAHINQGTCTSCGCAHKEKAANNISTYQKSVQGKPKQDYIGYKSGKLTVISFSHIDKNHHSVWNCQCECGNIKQVASPQLAKKDTKSCGCLKQSYGSYKIEQILLFALYYVN